MTYICKPTKATGDQYWFAKNADGTIHTGATEPGLVTRSGAVEFEYGQQADVATKLQKYADRLPEEATEVTDDVSPAFVRDASGNVKWGQQRNERAAKE